MKWIPLRAAIVLLSLLVGPSFASADAGTDELREQFNSVINGLNDNSFERLHRAIDKKDMMSRIYSNRLIETDVKKAFGNDFSISIEQMFASSFPESKTEILGTVIDFDFKGGEGRAVVRFASSGYRYSYHIYELRQDSKGRVVVVDWIDYYKGNQFSDEAGDSLVMAMPSKQATRSVLSDKNLGDADIFQVAELFKAVRDNRSERFFQIYDGLSDVVAKEAAIIKLNLHSSLLVRDRERIEGAIQMLEDKRPGDALFSLRLIEYYIPTRQYDKAIDALTRLQDDIGVRDGASESLKASAALAMGNTADAEKFALQATVVEPSLEVAWWSLLRARTRGENYSGATEALARLEDDFGHTLDPKKLRRDRFLKVLVDQSEYLDWRASRK